MPTYSNIHAHLDNSEIHPPRDFSLAGNDTFLSKSLLGEIAWSDTYWQRPILGVLDRTLEPPTSNHGDRYALVDMRGTTFCGTALQVVTVTTTVDGTAVDGTALEPYDVYGSCTNLAWGGANVNDIVEYFAIDKNAEPINEWKAVSPQAGYVAANLDTGTNWFYNGAVWRDEGAWMRDTFEYYESHTLGETMAKTDFVKGKKYWISDRNIMLEAVDENRLGSEGDHTREIVAYATIDLTGDSGSIDSIIANGTELLATPVIFVDDLIETASYVMAAINEGTSTHGYTATKAVNLVILFAPAGLGAVANGYTVAASATGITATVTGFSNGQNIGANWFRVRYNIYEDKIVEMSDQRGNHVICSTEGAAVIPGANGIDVFPWGYANVFNNKVVGGSLQAHASTGLIGNNNVSGTLVCDGFGSGACIANEVGFYSTFNLSRASNYVVANNTQLGSIINAQLISATFTNNTFQSVQMEAAGFAGSFERNTMNMCTSFDIRKSLGLIRNNTFVDSDFVADHSNASFNNNSVLYNSEIHLTNASGDISHNSFTSCNVDLSNFSSGSFIHNQVSQSILTATYCSGSINTNVFDGNGNKKFDNFSGESVSNNQFLASTNVDATGASGIINSNHVFASTIDLRNFSGTGFRQNRLHNSTFSAPNCSGDIDANILDTGTIEADSCSGGIWANTINSDSVLKLNGFAGDKMIKCILKDSSVVNAENSIYGQGAINVEGHTILDLTGANCIVYQLRTFLPDQTMKINSTIIGGDVNYSYSNYTVGSSIDADGILNLDQDFMRFAGTIYITNSSSLNTINGLSTLPMDFIILPSSGATITIDSSATTNIKLPSGITNILVNGETNDFLHFRKLPYGSNVIVSKIYNFD